MPKRGLVDQPLIFFPFLGQIAFGFYPPRDVHIHALKKKQPPGIIFDRVGLVINPDDAPLPVDEPVLLEERRLGLCGPRS